MESGLTIAGKYRLAELLGAGGMASVWSATNIFTERQFAIKFMLPQVARTPEAARRFLMEAKVSARVNHPNVIEIIDVGQTEDGTLFLVMELLSGVSLETAMRRQTPPMTLRELSFVMLEVARALVAAHKNGVVHRDLKPTNIFLHKDREGAAHPKLLDFGVSKFLEDEGNHGLTVAGTVLGSPLYMSPEQARGDSNIDGRTDAFAFGGILFEALCGVRAYEGANFNQLIVAIATTQPKSIDDHAPHVPESLRSIVRDCLVTDREKRLGSFEEITERLAKVLPELQESNLRIPSPLKLDSLSDPDATNALPIRRPSDMPPPLSLSGAGPPGVSSPWATPSGSHKASTMSTVSRRRGSSGMWAFVSMAVGATIVGAGAFGVMRYRARGVGRPGPVAVQTAPIVTAALASSHAASDLPVISVDSLPVVAASSSAATARAAPPLSPSPPKGSGRLSIAASRGVCTVSIDGASRGPTPIPAIDLPVGPHQLRCDSPNGKSKTERMVIQDGASTRYKFNTDD